MPLVVAYLAFNGIAYLLLGLWCAVSVDKTAAAVGFKTLDASGRCEYTTIYGGLQWALGSGFLAAAYLPDYRLLGLLLGVGLYAWLCLARLIGLLRFGPVAPMTLGFAAFEWLMLFAGGGLLLMYV